MESNATVAFCGIVTKAAGWPVVLQAATASALNNPNIRQNNIGAAAARLLRSNDMTIPAAAYYF
jgi:hypothetical protein